MGLICNVRNHERSRPRCDSTFSTQDTCREDFEASRIPPIKPPIRLITTSAEVQSICIIMSFHQSFLHYLMHWDWIGFGFEPKS